MRYTLEDILEQAQEDSYTASLDGDGMEANILYGIRIEKIKHTGEINIHNTTKGGDFYSLVPKEELEDFFERGWRYGVFNLALSNYRSKLDIIESKIRDEVNSRKNAKHIQSLKANRERIMQRFAKVSQKLNLIK
jgi:hypothetical protein